MFSLFREPFHDDVIKWKYFPRHWPFVRGIHQWPVKSPHKRLVTRSFDVFFYGWVNDREAGDWRRHRAPYDVIVVVILCSAAASWNCIWTNNRDAGDLRHHRAHYDVMVMREKYIKTYIGFTLISCHFTAVLCHVPFSRAGKILHLN